MRLALDPATTHNQGFRRDDAQLVVLLMTDEDDCSAKDPDLLFDPSQTAMDSTLGPLSAFRCFEFGVTCDPDGRMPGPRDRCRPREDATALLHPPSRYLRFLRALPAPHAPILAALAGPVNDGHVEVVLDEYGYPEVEHSCSGRVRATPGIRLRSVVAAFTKEADMHWAYSSVCAPGFTDALERLVEAIARRVDPRAAACLTAPLSGCADPGAAQGYPVDDQPCNDPCRADCAVTDRLRLDAPYAQSIPVPPCRAICSDGPCPSNRDPALAYAAGHPPERDPALPVAACWHIHFDARCQRSGGAQLRVSRRADPPAGTVTEARCRVAPSTEQRCDDGVDDDQDCRTDRDDPDCRLRSTPPAAIDAAGCDRRRRLRSTPPATIGAANGAPAAIDAADCDRRRRLRSTPPAAIDAAGSDRRRRQRSAQRTGRRLAGCREGDPAHPAPGTYPAGRVPTSRSASATISSRISLRGLISRMRPMPWEMETVPASRSPVSYILRAASPETWG
jgi:hypothetical protein